MVGKRDANFRKGDLAEGIGRELLRRFSAVVPVPREEDFGIDAICTLLRAEGPRTLYAENSFGVQFKSVSDRVVEYRGEAARWLRRLDIPLLIGSVDLAQSALTLYATENAHARYLHENVQQDILLCLDGGRVDPDPLRANGYDLGWHDDGTARIWMGTPVLEWTAGEAATPEFPLEAYRRLKPWLDFSAESRRLRSFGVYREVSVDGSQPPRTMSWSTASEYGDLDKLLDAVNPLLNRLSALLGHGFNEGPLLTELRGVRAFMRERGIVPVGMWEDPPSAMYSQAEGAAPSRVLVSWVGAASIKAPVDPTESK